jgi:hypothetical protein
MCKAVLQKIRQFLISVWHSIRKEAPIVMILDGKPVWSKNSCGLILIVFQKSTEPFSTVNRACTPVVCPCRRQE